MWMGELTTHEYMDVFVMIDEELKMNGLMVA